MSNNQYGSSTGSTLWSNTDTDYIEVSEANLRNVLNTHFSTIEKQCSIKDNWLAPFGIFITLTITMMTASFESINEYLNQDTIKGMVLLLTVAVGLWLLIAGWKAIFKKSDVKEIDDLIKDIRGKEVN